MEANPYDYMTRLDPFKDLKETLELLTRALDFQMPQARSSLYGPVYSFLRGAMPYTLESGWLLNRNYEPLVFTVYGNTYVSKQLDEDDAEFISTQLEHDSFFNDGSAPWRGVKEFKAFKHRLEAMLTQLRFYRHGLVSLTAPTT